jgi:hypothetical protein
MTVLLARCSRSAAATVPRLRLVQLRCLALLLVLLLLLLLIIIIITIIIIIVVVILLLLIMSPLLPGSPCVQ